jgi:AAA+ superfamily predicted ATPase
MDNFTYWHAQNREYLSIALTWLRERLARRVESLDPARPERQIEDVGEMADSEIALSEAERADSPPALLLLSQNLDLSHFEQEILLLCVAMELDTSFASLCAQAQHNPNQTYPTFALAFDLFDDPSWDALLPHRPLRNWQLVEINQLGSQPLVASALRADERIVNYVKGLNYLDDRLTPLLAPFETEASEEVLPPSQHSLCKTIIHHIQQDTRSITSPLVQLLGVDAASKQLIAHHVAAELGLRLYRMPVELLPSHAADLEQLARLWQRESRLLPIALYLDAYDSDNAAVYGPASPLKRFVARIDTLCFLDTRDVRAGIGPSALVFDVAKPTVAEQHDAWRDTLHSSAPESPALLAGHFNLGLSTIREIAQSVLRDQPQPGQSVEKLLWNACLVHTRPQLDILAERLTPKATWDDIVLRPEGLKLLHQIANQVQQRGKVYDGWGFRQRMNRGLGIIALFAGESGTGKTMAADVIANELHLNLYRIDLSAVVSKYIGETEKNLRQLFDAAENGGAILFFDEADALFGKRAQVRDSHDRYANIEINYLLQRMEAYQGLAILATNMKANLDDAFMRRLRFVVDFPVPEVAERKRIWEKVFPAETPLGELDTDWLAKHKLAGGSIYNAALNAAFLAAQAGMPVSMDHLVNAIQTEWVKSGRIANDFDFGLPEPKNDRLSPQDDPRNARFYRRR